MTRFDRLGGWAGAAFAVLSLAVVPFSLTPPMLPVVGADGAAFAEWYAAHRLGFLVGNWLGVAAFIPGLVQLAALAARIRAREGDTAFFSMLVLGAGTFAYAVFAASLCAFQAMPFLVTADRFGSAEALGTLTSVWFSLDGLAGLVMVVAVGWAGAETGALPAWLVRSCVPLAIVLAVMSVGALTTSPTWLAAGGMATASGFVLFFAWTAAIAVAQLRAG